MTVFLSRFIGPVPLDVVVREIHESDLTITTNPVEFGANVADHAYVEPKRLRLDAVAGSRPGIAANVAGAYQALQRLQEARQPFDVVTGLSLYRNMLVHRLIVDRDSKFARVLFFSAELQEVIIVDTETTEGTGSGTGAGNANGQRGRTSQSGQGKNKLAEGPVRDRGSPTTQRGNSATREVREPRDQSTLRAAYEAWKG
jgi:hypothetical protein